MFQRVTLLCADRRCELAAAAPVCPHPSNQILYNEFSVFSFRMCHIAGVLGHIWDSTSACGTFGLACRQFRGNSHPRTTKRAGVSALTRNTHFVSATVYSEPMLFLEVSIRCAALATAQSGRRLDLEPELLPPGCVLRSERAELRKCSATTSEHILVPLSAS